MGVGSKEHSQEKTHCLVLAGSWGIISLFLLYVLWLLFRCFVADYFSIPTQSMIPTLYPGDKVLVNKLLFGARIYQDFNFTPQGSELHSIRMKGLRRIRRNDIVVFNLPYHNGRVSFVINNVFCKRIVAIPGDSISTVNGIYCNNNFEGTLGIKNEQLKFSAIPDSLLPKEILNTVPFDDEHCLHTTKNMKSIYVPRKGDIIYVSSFEAAYYKMILEWETGKKITWNWGKNEAYANGKRLTKHRFTHNYYFVAGDNVLDSNDSRYWGPVPEEYIVGVVSNVYHKDKK